MGLTLSEPVTNKESAYCQNDQFRVGSSCMQGWRVHMEDSHTHILSLPDDPQAAFFAVYDGHGGANVAQYAGKHLHKFIVKRPEYEENPEEAMKQVSVCVGMRSCEFPTLHRYSLPHFAFSGRKAPPSLPSEITRLILARNLYSHLTLINGNWVGMQTAEQMRAHLSPSLATLCRVEGMNYK
uniref:Uncharacterized protein n=1 Tax=Phlebotomus papatasi TaxID=29031 RepID=A0A1B0EYM4_PHLPP